MNAHPMNRILNEETRRRISKEVKRAIPPWILIFLGTLALGLAISCMVSAFGH